MLADTRTNAGVDNISTYRKLHIYGNDGKRLIVVASAGSISTTQTALERVSLGMTAPDTGVSESIDTATSIHRAASLLGQAIRFTRDELEGGKHDELRRDPSWSAARRRAHPAVPGLRGRQLHRVLPGHALRADRRDQVRQANPRSLAQLRHRPRRGGEDRPAVVFHDHALEPRRGPAHRHDDGAPGSCTAELVRRIDDQDDYYRDLNDRWSVVLRAARASIPKPPYR